MKKLIVATGLIFSFVFQGSLFSQDIAKDKQERKEEKKVQIRKEYEVTQQILNSKQFVLEANWLGNQYGERIPVTSNINFIIVDSTNAVVQVGSNSGLGYNGVGGITADGPVTDWELASNERKNSFHLKMNVMTNLGIYDITMNITADGYATATLRGLRRGQLIYSGIIVPIQESFVYQGNSSY